MLKNVKMFVSVSLVVVCLVGCGTLASKRNMYSGEVSNAAVIRSPETVIVGAIDNKSVGVSIGGEREYGVLPGEHELIVEYSDYWAPDFGDGEKVVSRPVKLLFVAAANQKYQIEHEEITSLGASRTFSKEPIFRIKNLSTNEWVNVSMELSEPKSFIPSISFESTPEYEFRSKNLDVESRGGILGEGEEEKRLKAAWQASSDEVKAKFLRWISSQ